MKSGGALRDAIAKTYRTKAESFVGPLEMRIEKARVDPEVFTELVMRTEVGQKRVKLAAHQRVGMRFMLEHQRSVNIWPVNHAKSYLSIALTLYFIGQNPSLRGAIVSATQGQAMKLVRMVAEYIRWSPMMFLIFGIEPGEKWTDAELIVKRPFGIKDPTLRAYGEDSRGIPGTRLDWAVCDDLLGEDNTASKERRDSLATWFHSTVESRIEQDGKIVLTNSAWHPEDLLHHLEALGWATLRMQVDGHLFVKDDIMDLDTKKVWDHPLLMPCPSGDPGDVAAFGERLRLNVPGRDERSALWPEMFPGEDYLERLRKMKSIPAEFNRLYMSICRDDGSAYCKTEWVEKCKAEARKRGYFSLTQRRKGGNSYTGVDLAVSKNEGSDDCAFFTFEVLPSGHRLILDIEIGKFDGPTIVKKVAGIHDRYDSIVRIENNAAQEFVLQFVRDQAGYVPLKAHTTGRNKANADHGVHSVFTDMANGLWLIPNDKHGNVHPHVQRWIDDCLYYKPSKHVGDSLMASWFAREQAREFGALAKINPEDAIAGAGSALAGGLLMR